MKHRPADFCSYKRLFHTEVLDALRKCNAKPHFMPPDCTDVLQLIDAGIGFRTEQLLKNHYKDWLEKESNLERWTGGEVSASERRVMNTKWLGDAYEEVVNTINISAIGKNWLPDDC